MSSDRNVVVVPLAAGFEEIEAVTIIDVLRRADIAVTTAALGELEVEGSHGITVRADVSLEDVEAAEVRAVVLPGGMPGSQHLHDDDRVTKLVKNVVEAEGLAGAICAAPMALGPSGVTAGRRVTSYPTFRERVVCGAYSEETVVVDGPVITSRGVGTALEFALTLVERLTDGATAAAVREKMLVKI